MTSVHWASKLHKGLNSYKLPQASVFPVLYSSQKSLSLNICSLCVQGEQCNVVPDTIDDIVADIGQEEKNEGTVNEHTHTHTLFLDYHYQGKALNKIP